VMEAPAPGSTEAAREAPAPTGDEHLRLSPSYPEFLVGLIGGMAGPVAQRRLARAAAWLRRSHWLSWPPPRGVASTWAMPHCILEPLLAYLRQLLESSRLFLEPIPEESDLARRVRYCLRHAGPLVRRTRELIAFFDRRAPCSAEVRRAETEEAVLRFLEDAGGLGGHGDLSATEAIAAAVMSAGCHEPDANPDVPVKLMILAVRQERRALIRFLAECWPSTVLDGPVAPVPDDLAGHFEMRFDLCSPLGVACLLGKDSTVRLLLECRSDPNQTPFTAFDHAQYQDYSPLMVACERGHSAAAAALLEWGARVDEICAEDWSVRDEWQTSVEYREYTALTLACFCGHVETVQLLLRAGAWADLECAEVKGDVEPLPRVTWQSSVDMAAAWQAGEEANELGGRLLEVLRASLPPDGGHGRCSGCQRCRRRGWFGAGEWAEAWFCSLCWESHAAGGVRRLEVASGCMGGGLVLGICADVVTLEEDMGSPFDPHDDPAYWDSDRNEVFARRESVTLEQLGELLDEASSARVL